MAHKQIRTLAKNIRKLRKEHDDIAIKADIPFTTLTKIETGVIKKSSVFTVQHVADALNVSVDDLLS